MAPHLHWSGVLALLSLALPLLGGLLMLHSAGSLTGLTLIVGGLPLAVAAWIALGTPVTRRQIQRAPNRH